jgi:hypothetical protein
MAGNIVTRNPIFCASCTVKLEPILWPPFPMIPASVTKLFSIKLDLDIGEIYGREPHGSKIFARSNLEHTPLILAEMRLDRKV